MMKPSLNNLLCLWCFIVEVTADWASGEVSVKQLGANSSAIDGIELEKGIKYLDLCSQNISFENYGSQQFMSSL